MANVYYIDGYNVRHRSSVLKPLAARSFETARVILGEAGHPLEFFQAEDGIRDKAT